MHIYLVAIFFPSQIVVNTVMYCLCVWLVLELLRWFIGWAFFREKSRKVFKISYICMLHVV